MTRNAQLPFHLRRLFIAWPALLVVCALAGCGSSTQGSGSAGVIAAADEAEAAAALEQLGVDLRRTDGRVHFADFYLARNAEQGMPHLKSFPRLQVIVLSSSQVTDAEMKHLAAVPGLEHLSLNNTAITDEGLAPLAKLEKLNHLNVNETMVSDKGLEVIAGLANLQRLFLHHTQVTDEGLKHLEGLKSLKTLSLTGSKVTPEGVARLRRALPDAYIEFDIMPEIPNDPLLPARPEEEQNKDAPAEDP